MYRCKGWDCEEFTCTKGEISAKVRNYLDGWMQEGDYISKEYIIPHLGKGSDLYYVCNEHGEQTDAEIWVEEV